MSSIRNQIITQAILELNTGRPSDVALFERVNNRPRDVAQVPANVLYPVDESIEPVHNRTSPLVERPFTLRIEMRAAGGDEDVDPVLIWITKTLMPSRLNNLCHDIQESRISWAFKRRAQPYCLCVLDLNINYGTSRVDQERTR